MFEYEIGALIAGGIILAVGTAFALFLGAASGRIEHTREETAGH
jgi:hypothetical protein